MEESNKFILDDDTGSNKLIDKLFKNIRENEGYPAFEKILDKIMDRNEIKKFLYKEKPDAYIYEKDDKFFYYMTAQSSGMIVKFKVPIEDMGDHRFKGVEPSQLLIRWIAE